MKIGFIGVGKMASAIITSLKQTEHDIIISGSSPQRSQTIAETLKVAFVSSHEELIAECDLIILGIKPQMFDSVLAPLNFKQPIISMAAGVTLARLATLTDHELPICRIMPNITAQIGQSTTAICPNEQVSPDLLTVITAICQHFGTSYQIAETDFDTFTALTGSSPAYIALFIEALAKAGVNNGFHKEKSLELILQTILATVQQLQLKGSSPHQLIDEICSPGGATIAGLMTLEQACFTYNVSAAIDKTIEKARHL